MSIKKMTKEELELLSYTDITNLILEEGPLTTPELFRIIVDKLELGNKVYENKIGNYYTSLTIDKRFILLDSGKWDLKTNHPTKNKIILDDDLEDIDDLVDEDTFDDLVEEEEEKESDDFYENDDNEADNVAEEYKNLVIISEEDLDKEE